MMRRSSLGIAATLLAAVACTNAGESLAVPAVGTGAISVGVFFDRDGSDTQTGGDTTFTGVRVALVAPGGTDTIRTATTNNLGLALFDSLPLGSYRVVVDRHALADSVGLVAGDTGTVRIVSSTDSSHLVRIVRLGYAEVTLAAARLLPAGKRILVHAKVASPLQLFRDSSAFLFDSSGTIRVTGARPRPGSAGNNIGDSVLVLGTTGQRSGQGVIQDGVFTGLSVGIAPLPLVTSVVDAINAKGGKLDATLIQLSNVTITDTLVSGPDFIVKLADPADLTVKISMVLDQLLAAPHGLFVPTHTGTFRGVLVPVGDGSWILKPRSGADIILN